MSEPKVSRSLAERLERAEPGELLDLVVELHPCRVEETPGLSTGDRVAPVHEAFQREAAPVEAAIREAGGEVRGTAWINQTIRARVPRESVARLAALDGVAALDTPRRMNRDGG